MTIQAPVLIMAGNGAVASGSPGSASTIAAPAGGLIIANLGVNASADNGKAFTSVTDSGGNTYNLIQPGALSGVTQVCFAWCITSVALPIGTTWTPVTSGSVNWASHGIIYVPGAQGGLDKFSVQNYNGSATSSSSLPATQPLYVPGEIAIGMLYCNPQATSIGAAAGFSTIFNSGFMDFSYDILSGIGAVTYQPGSFGATVTTYSSVVATFMPSLGTGVVGAATCEW